MKVSLLLACAGTGSRAGQSKNKLLVDINGKTPLSLTINEFVKSGLIDEYIIVCNQNDYNYIYNEYSGLAKIVIGGAARTQSVQNGLNEVSGDIVLIHDGARPFVTQKMIEDCIATVKEYGSAIPVIPCPDTIVKEQESVCYIGKKDLYCLQTPQGFNTDKIKKAYDNINGQVFNDDGEIYLNTFNDLKTYTGDSKNIKITYPEDFEKLKEINSIKVGTGFDCHKLVENRKLIIGGIEIPHDKGLLGHSDADVLTHAIMDAILSALSLRDIGYHFPDTDPKYKGAFSIDLLKEVMAMVKDKGYVVNNISAVIMAEKPKLLKHIPTITQNLANIIGISVDDLGIGATTLEGLGFVGREEGICVSATATLKKI